jgi:hypothetical protein
MIERARVRMSDGVDELNDLRLDIETLRTMIDISLDKGARGDDPLLKACADTLHERQTRFDQLEAALRTVPNDG